MTDVDLLRVYSGTLAEIGKWLTTGQRRSRFATLSEME